MLFDSIKLVTKGIQR